MAEPSGTSCLGQGGGAHVFAALRSAPVHAAILQVSADHRVPLLIILLNRSCTPGGAKERVIGTQWEGTYWHRV